MDLSNQQPVMNGTSGPHNGHGHINQDSAYAYDVVHHSQERADDAVMEDELYLYVNGRCVRDRHVAPHTTLAEYLRHKLALTGTKVGCSEGGCGACTVMLSQCEPHTGHIRHYSVVACLWPVLQCHGLAVTTVEGLHCHAVQTRLAAAHGSQCGFCTPGFVMAMYALLRNRPLPTKHDVHAAVSGNLCRCTGYRPILEAFYSFADDKSAPKSAGCCGKQNGCCRQEANAPQQQQSGERLAAMAPYDHTQEPIFPPKLKKLITCHGLPALRVCHETGQWVAPGTLQEALAAKSSCRNSRFVFGNTEIGIEQSQLHRKYDLLINTRHLTELRTLHVEPAAVTVGSGYSLAEMASLLHDICQPEPTHNKFQAVAAVLNMLKWFAGVHVRNMANFAGNLATASPISDLNQIWLAVRATVHLISETGARSVKVDGDFFTGYRATIIQPNELITAISIPLLQPAEHAGAFKQCLRRDDDRAIVNAAFWLKRQPVDNTVVEFRAAFGGMAPVTKLASTSGAVLIGRRVTESTIDDVLRAVGDELQLPDDVPGGLSDYRLSLAKAFTFKFLSSVLFADNGHKHERNALRSLDVIDETIESTQIFRDQSDSAGHEYVHRPIAHLAADLHVSGQAQYTDDIRHDDALHLALVMSELAHGRVRAVHTAAASRAPGVLLVLDHSSVPHNRLPSSPVHPATLDYRVFADEEVVYHSQPLAAVVAHSARQARDAARLVRVQYEPLTPIVTIKDAIAASSFHNKQPLRFSNSLQRWEDIDKHYVVEGETSVGGQEHFYLEPHAVVAEPGEADSLTVWASTQGVSHVQQQLSAALGLAAHKVVVKVRRIGGGFGGKESPAVTLAVPCALAARVLNRRVRAVLTRSEDMAVTGTRHPFLICWRLAADRQMRLTGYEATYYSNAGHSWDLSQQVMLMGMSHADGGYTIPHITTTGYCCKTNIQSCTAFRGFGSPQSMLAIENAICALCDKYGLDGTAFRQRNLASEGDMKFCGRPLVNCNLTRCWNEVQQLAGYTQLRQQVDDYNRGHRHSAQGVSIVPTKYGIGFGERNLNQAGCLLNVYVDGSVRIAHAGMEMGQGLHTKVAQVAAHVLDIPLSLVHIDHTGTDTVPNTSPTAASISSDLNCQAVQNACNELQRRLRPYRTAGRSWVQAVQAAYNDCVSLSTTAFHKLPLSSFDQLLDGRPHVTDIWAYCVYGAAVSHVQVDTLTGDHKILASFIVMDIGDSLNPALDIGQIEGAFTQGYGLTCMEQLKCSADGRWLTRGPGTYKIPAVDDCPRRLHVKLLSGSSNPGTVFSSKAVGEPPLFLGSSVYFAIRHACLAVRRRQGIQDALVLHSPATPDRVLHACQQPQARTDTGKTWAVELS